MRTEVRICTRCILPETFPGISFDEEGVCNHCRREEKALAKSPGKKASYRDRLDTLIADIKGTSPTYDAVMAYSGGKDSSYTLKLLKERYGLRILAITFDNHFVSPIAWQNIATMTNALSVDHMSFRPPWKVAKAMFTRTAREDLFPTPTLLRASAICTACIGLVKNIVLKSALEMSVPMIAFGWSPGQAPIQSAIMKTNPGLTKQSMAALKNAFPAEMADEMARYFIPDGYFKRFKTSFPYNVHPLAFFDYDEEGIKKELVEMGWQVPSDTDTNSTNCLLNAFANHCHLERHHFHPYVWEIANMVRQGVMSREEGIEKIYSDQNQEMVDYAKKKLEL